MRHSDNVILLISHKTQIQQLAGNVSTTTHCSCTSLASAIISKSKFFVFIQFSHIRYPQLMYSLHYVNVSKFLSVKNLVFKPARWVGIPLFLLYQPLLKCKLKPNQPDSDPIYTIEIKSRKFTSMIFVKLASNIISSKEILGFNSSLCLWNSATLQHNYNS